jgi:hypothetical protein
MSAIALQFPSDRDYPRSSFTPCLNLINGFREAQEISYRYEQLSHLSDAEFAPHGIPRQDLARIALTSGL